ncbi:MAG: DUF2634 domain-containing protein [Bacillota bacterium]|nr:DUF2634 domain-containing protein [Bacillota bacterium]
MIPAVNDDLTKDFEIKELPARTFRVTTENTINGMTDGLEAVKQAVYLILNTERYEYLIYSWNYGIELKDLYGKPIPYLLPELKRRITEALVQDSRITDVGAFDFETGKGKILVTFTVSTIYGEIEAEKAVSF